MTYEYRCTKCGHVFDVIKPVRDMGVNEFCPSCAHPAERKFVPSRLHLSKTAVQHAEYNPAFGCVVKDKRHRDDLAKRRGMVEIGNDFKAPDTIHKEYEVAREVRAEARYEKALKEVT